MNAFEYINEKNNNNDNELIRLLKFGVISSKNPIFIEI